MSRINVDKITGKTGTNSGAPITLSGDTATLSGTGVTFPAGHIKNVHIAAGRYNLADGQQTISNDTEVRVSNVLTVSVTQGYKYFFIFSVPTIAVGGNVNSQTNKSIRFYIRKPATASPSDGSGIASETLIHSTGQNTRYVSTNHNGPVWTGAVCGIYTATATGTNYFCGSAMTGESGSEDGYIIPTDINAMLICQEIFQ